MASEELSMQEKIAAIEDRLANGDEILVLIPQLLAEVQKLAGDLRGMKTIMDETNDIVVAWGNIKGFGRTMQFISTVLKTAALITTATGTLYYVITHHGQVTTEIVEKINAS